MRLVYSTARAMSSGWKDVLPCASTKRIILDTKKFSLCQTCQQKGALEIDIPTLPANFDLPTRILFDLISFQSQSIKELYSQIYKPAVFKGLNVGMLDDQSCKTF